jgi:hypothetical protein
MRSRAFAITNQRKPTDRNLGVAALAGVGGPVLEVGTQQAEFMLDSR